MAKLGDRGVHIFRAINIKMISLLVRIIIYQIIRVNKTEARICKQQKKHSIKKNAETRSKNNSKYI